jgi:hypothetical protein
MKSLILSLVFTLAASIAIAKPLKIETLDGKLVRCGEWKNTTNAVVIRGCPELGALFESTPDPEPTPTPTVPPPVATPSPTATPAPTRQIVCEKRFVDTAHGVQFLNNYFAPGEEVKYCAYIPSNAPRFIELQGQNHSNTSCNFYFCELISPSGVSYECDGSQPGTTITKEVGTWQINIELDDSEETLCAEPWGLSLTFRTKG